MKFKKIILQKTLYALVAVALLLSMVPTTIFAVDQPEMPYISINGVKATVDNQSDILNNGTCSLFYNESDSIWEITLNNASLTKNIMLGHPARGSFGNFRIILQGTNKIEMASDSNAIVGANGGDIEITGDGSLSISTVKENSGISMNSLSSYPDNGNLTLDGANLTLNTQAMAFNVTKNINILNGSKVTATITSPYNAVIKAMNNVNVIDSELNLTATESAEYAAGIKTTNYDVNIKNSNVTINSNGCAVYAYGNVTITDTELKANSRADSALFANDKFTINGATKLQSNGYFRAIQAVGFLEINGGIINATSDNDIAIWSVDSIALNGGEIHAKGAPGKAAIGARLTQVDETAPTAKITMDENYEEVSGGVIAVSNLYAYEDKFRSKTSFIAKDETELSTDLSNAMNDITIRIKSADYTKVDEAIAKIPADLSLYTDASVKALNDAKANVVLGKSIKEQSIVDGYATAIENAIKALEKKETSKPNVPSDSNNDANTNSPETGDSSNIFSWIALMSITGGALIVFVIAKKYKRLNSK